MPRQCLFCPNKADTKEHLWAGWALEGLPRPGTPIRSVIGKSAPREFHGDVRIKCACNSCNHGWMSDLEGKVKPFVGAMIHDISLRLTIGQQHDIALWAVKTAMVLEGVITHRPRFFDKSECEQLRLASFIPERTLIWLGRISQCGVFASGTYIWLEDNLLKTNDGYVATFTLGHLAIQTLTIRVPREHHSKPLTTRCFDGPWDNSLLGIYPANQTVVWPPRLTFSLHGPLLFTALRDRWKIGRSV